MKRRETFVKNLKKLGGRIRHFREKRNLTLEDLAAERLSIGNLCEIENGRRDPRFSTLCTISKKLKVPISSLIDDLC